MPHGERRIPLLDWSRSAWVMAQESVQGFIRNDDFRQASSLAFYTALAMIPALLLLTSTVGLALGSSTKAFVRTAGFIDDIIPRFSEVLLAEVGALSRRTRTVGFLNLLIMLWSISPLVSAMRSIITGILKQQVQRPFWLSKLLDLATVLLFITCLATVTGMDVAIKMLTRLSKTFVPPGWLGFSIPFLATVLLLVLMYYVLTPKVKARYLLAGALATTVLWFLMRPAFSLFLTYNPGYGLTFGSFKSLFLIIIWIYYSQAAFLFGAEVMAALHRKDTVFIRRLLAGQGGVSAAGRSRYVRSCPAGTCFFQEGDSGTEMFHVLSGRVSIQREGREMAIIEPGKVFGEMSFLLEVQRTATAVAREDCEVVVINQRNMNAMMQDSPETIRQMLREMALRLDSANRK